MIRLYLKCMYFIHSNAHSTSVSSPDSKAILNLPTFPRLGRGILFRFLSVRNVTALRYGSEGSRAAGAGNGSRSRSLSAVSTRTKRGLRRRRRINGLEGNGLRVDERARRTRTTEQVAQARQETQDEKDDDVDRIGRRGDFSNGSRLGGFLRGLFVVADVFFLIFRIGDVSDDEKLPLAGQRARY